MSDLARPQDGPGSCPDGSNPSVSSHSACDPSRGPAALINFSLSAKQVQDVLTGWLSSKADACEWQYYLAQKDGRYNDRARVAIEFYNEVRRLFLAQGMEALVAETVGLGAKPDSPVTAGHALDVKREGEMKKEDVA